MRKLVSLVVTLVVAVGVLGGGTWADGNLETYSDYDFSYIFMNDKYTSYDEAAYANGKTLVMGGGFGHQYALIQGEDVQIVSNNIGEHLDLFSSSDIYSRGNNFYIAQYKTFGISSDGINWTKIKLSDQECIFIWNEGYSVVNEASINVIGSDFEPTFLYEQNIDYFEGYYYWRAYPDDDTPFLDHAKILRSQDLKNWSIFIDDVKEGDFNILERKNGPVLALDYSVEEDNETHYYTDYMFANADGKAQVVRTEKHTKGMGRYGRPTEAYTYNREADEYYSTDDAVLYVSKDKDSDTWTKYDALAITKGNDKAAKSNWYLKSDGTYEIVCENVLITVDSSLNEEGENGTVIQHTLSNGQLYFVYDENLDRTYGYDEANNIYRINDNGLWEKFSKIDADFFKYSGKVDGVHYAVTANEEERYNLMLSRDGFNWSLAGQFPEIFLGEEASCDLILDMHNDFGNRYYKDKGDKIGIAQVSKINDGVLIRVSAVRKNEDNLGPQFFKYKEGSISQLAIAPKLVPIPGSSSKKYFYRQKSYYAFDKAVTTGIYGTFATSADGNVWDVNFDVYKLLKSVKKPEFHGLDTGIHSFDPLMAAIGDYAYFPIEGTKKVLRTPDLKSFKVVSMNIPSIIRSDIAYGYGKYYGVGTDGKLYESSDIINWSAIGEGIGVTIAPGIEISFDQGHVLVKAEKIHRFKVK